MPDEEKPMLDVEEIKKLPPTERIKALKKLQEHLAKKKKEQEQAEEAIADVEEDTEKEIEHILKITPQQAQVDTNELFKRSPLEDEAKKAPEQETEQARRAESYEEIRAIYNMAAQEVYERIKAVKKRSMEGRMTDDDIDFVKHYQNQIEAFIPKMHYVRDEKVKDAVDKAQETLKDIERYNPDIHG